MLDARIYRTSLILVVLAVIVVAFSLTDQQGALTTTLPPEAFNGQNAYLDMVGLERKYPDRAPGSRSDEKLASKVAAALAKDGFSVSTRSATARTASGTRSLETVVGTRAGLSSSSIVVLAHRDQSGAETASDVSGTAVLLELARVLSGQTPHRSIALISTSGSAGAAGATQLARRLGNQVDAVIALGDLASANARRPVVVPWSNGQQVAPPVLRNTVAAALNAQAGLAAGSPSLGSQFAHLAFPMSVTEQGPFGVRGYPAVLLSLAGERPGGARQPADRGRIAALGRTALETVNALDAGPSVPSPRPYLMLGGKVIPGWAIRLLVLALTVPVLLTTIDGLARARRRGRPILRWLAWVLAGALPFLLAALVVLAARLTGLLDATPPGPLGAGAVPLGGAGAAVIVLLAAVIAASLFARRWLLARTTSRGRSAKPDAGTGAAVLLVLCVIALLIWTQNPFAAALLLPALHLWMWVLDPELQLPRPVTPLLVVLGLLPPLLVIGLYAVSLGLGPVDAVWNGVLLIAGGYIGVVAAVQWSVVLGCSASLISVAVRRPRAERPRPEGTPVTMRGPITYAGPGSLGGTESALRR
jgi:Peptidase family M28